MKASVTAWCAGVSPPSAMFRVVESIISRQLKRAIEGQGGGAKSMTVKNGRIEVVDFLFSPDALEETVERGSGSKLPVTFEMVHCGHLQVVLPWKDWPRGLIEISIKDVNILCRPCDYSTVMSEKLKKIKEERVRNIMKNLLLEAYEGLTAESKDDSAKQSQPPKGAAARKAMRDQNRLRWVLRKLLSTLTPKVSIENVHVRFEDLGHDDEPQLRSPCAVGLVIGAHSRRHRPHGLPSCATWLYGEGWLSKAAHTHMHMCTCAHTRAHTHTRARSARTRTHTHIHTHTHLYICTYARTHICTWLQARLGSRRLRVQQRCTTLALSS